MASDEHLLEEEEEPPTLVDVKELGNEEHNQGSPKNTERLPKVPITIVTGSPKNFILLSQTMRDILTDTIKVTLVQARQH
jgi:hypothetical protein